MSSQSISYASLSTGCPADAAKFNSAVSMSMTQLTAFRATFYLLTFVAGVWLVAVGSTIFALRAFDTSTERAKSVSQGSIYMATFLLVLIINVAIISPALLMLQPFRLWKMYWRSRRAVTPRQHFRGMPCLTMVAINL